MLAKKPHHDFLAKLGHSTHKLFDKFGTLLVARIPDFIERFDD
jgi:hypothetical protein